MFVTLLIGLGVTLLILGPLIILHEFGHYFAARMSGVRPLEFGFGFPPRITGFWTGKTRFEISSATQFISLARPPGMSDESMTDEDANTDLRETVREDVHTVHLRLVRLDPSTGEEIRPDPVAPGKKVTVVYEEQEDGTKRALEVRAHQSGDDFEARSNGEVLVGKVRSVRANELVLKDMMWSLNWLPFGGFVRLRGEENPSASDSMAGKSPIIRAFVLLAGIAVNAVLPFIIFAVASQVPQERVIGDVVVRQVLPDSPAYEAGLRSHYKVLEVDGSQITTIGGLQAAVTRKLGAESSWLVQRGIPDPFAGPDEPSAQYDPDDIEILTMVPRWDPPRHELVEEVTDPSTQMRLAVARTFNSSVGLNDRLTVVEQGAVADTLREVGVDDIREYVPEAAVGDEIRIVETLDEYGLHFILARQFDPRLGAVTYLQEGAVGVTLGLESPRIESVTVPLARSIQFGFRATWEVLVIARNSIVGAFSGSNNPQFEGPIAVGPVGIGQLSGEVATSDTTIASRIFVLLTLAATLSISLAFINLLPIPGLDGGRLLFVLIEVARRGKRISPERENLVHLAGFLVLVGLLIVVSFLDISRLFSGESFF